MNPQAPETGPDGLPNEAALPRIDGKAVALFVLASLVLLAALFLIGWVPRSHRLAQLREDAAAAGAAMPIVSVNKPEVQSPTTVLELPGDTCALQETDIHPRANGYLKLLHADIGDHVQAGQLLAVIDTPEIDAQLDQAKAALSQAKAALAQVQAQIVKAAADRDLAQGTYDRYAAYATSGGVTKQQLDERHSTLDQAKAAYSVAEAAAGAGQAAIEAAQADVRRLTDQQNFEKVTAPFTGTITQRNYDVGTLLSATNTGPGGQLFRLAQDDPMRVFVNVPQAYIGLVKPGVPAVLTVRNYPGRKFTGKVVRSTDELDPATRTLRFEIHIDNTDHALFPGMYGQVHFDLHQDQPLLTVPSSALLFESEGLQVAVVRHGQAHFQRIEIARDLGTKVEVSQGLQGSEDVVIDPGERLAEGVQVQVLSSQAAAASPMGPPVPEASRTAEQAPR